ncbi:transcriptional regulator [uncultured Acinetobacter sp.]|uniref:CopG family ribbon-helix-helix protein n=1 Tax=uncultured Acinetobacter sp. TaxID=165433 RepID=UPI00261148F4|nr:transcriptional regulator [uncultured Acinetobacter sp.]
MPKSKLARISITLPQSTLIALDEKIVDPHYENRSQAIVEMIHQQLVSKNDQANAVMVGTLTVLYSIQSKNIHYQIIDLQQQYLKQIISSQHIQLNDQKIMQVMLLQGKSHDLKCISQSLIALKGVIKGHLELMDAVMPPLAQNDQLKEPYICQAFN